MDAGDKIRLINESAAEILGDTNAVPGALVGEVSPRLLYSLSTWRQREQGQESPSSFVAADGARVIQPHFAPLGAEPGPTLIFLEDTSLLAERVQQGKLAALGRLSASIAHEIRNPVGAMSHAGQLLAESSNIGADERRLTDIIRANSERVSTIINNVLQLSRREATKPTRLVLGDWFEDFLSEFCATMQVPPKTLSRPALAMVAALPWRGNAVELRALLEAVVAGQRGGRGIGLEDLLAHVKLDSGATVLATGGTLKQARSRFERDYIAAVLDHHHGRIGDAAKALGIQRTNLYRKMRSLSVARARRQ